MMFCYSLTGAKMIKDNKLLESSHRIASLLLERDEDTLEKVVEEMGIQAEVSRAYRFEFDESFMYNTEEFVNPREFKSERNPDGIESQINNLQKLPLDLFSDWTETLRKGKIIKVAHLNEAGFLPQTLDILKSQGIKSVIAMPVIYDNKLSGFLGFDECKFYREWDPQLVKYLETNARNVSMYLQNQKFKKELINNERKIRTLLDRTTDAEALCDKEGMITACNRELGRRVNKHPSEMVGTHIKSYFSDETNERRKKLVSKVLKTGQQVRVEEKKENGWNDLTISPIKDEDGNITQISIFGHDITDRKEAERALKKSEKRFRDLADMLPETIYETDNNLMITYANKTAFSMFRTDMNNPQPRNCLDFMVEEDREKAMRNLNSFQNGQKVGQVEYTAKREDGTTFPVLFHGSPIIENGEVKGFRGISVDITKIKQAEEKMRQTDTLTAVGEMAEGVAHDFNNCLQAILGNAEMASFQNDCPEIANYIETIRKSANDAASRIRQLQRFAGNSKKTDYTTLRIEDVIDDVVNQTRHLYKDESERRGIQIDVSTKYSASQRICGNMPDLRTVFYNLMKNSVQAMPDGGEIGIKTYDDNGNVFVEFSDTGSGMDEETKERVFRPFYTTKGFETGRGMGMSNVYSIIREHDGDIRISSSQPNEGTTFEISFNGVKYKEQNATEEQAENFSARVLWVDDEEMIRDIGSQMVEKLGHEPDIASDGVEALEKLANNGYHLMITDIGMPNMSGWDLAEEVKGKYNMQVALVSGWGDNVSEDEKEKYGIDYVLGKPVQMQQVKELLDYIGKD